MKRSEIEVGARVERVNVAIGQIKVGDHGTVKGINADGGIRVQFDGRTFVSTVYACNLRPVALRSPAPLPAPIITVPKRAPDAAFMRDGLSADAAFALDEALRAQPKRGPAPSQRWLFRREPRRAPTVKQACAAIARALRLI